MNSTRIARRPRCAAFALALAAEEAFAGPPATPSPGGRGADLEVR